MNVFCEKIGETIAYEEYPESYRTISWRIFSGVTAPVSS